MAKQISAQVFKSRDELAVRAAELIVEAAHKAISRHSVFRLALAGGSTPKRTYELLGSPAMSQSMDWSRTQVFWGDERMVPPSDAASNYGLAYSTLLSRVEITESNIFRMKGEWGAERAEQDYWQQLQSAFDGAPVVLDLALLGMGSDGHTASLFPGSSALEEGQKEVRANYVEALDSWRLTLTLPTLARARRLLFLVTGVEKAERVAEVLEYTASHKADLPSAALLAEAQGEVTWLLDTEAASGLSAKFLSAQQ